MPPDAAIHGKVSSWIATGFSLSCRKLACSDSKSASIGPISVMRGPSGDWYIAIRTFLGSIMELVRRSLALLRCIEREAGIGLRDGRRSILMPAEGHRPGVQDIVTPSLSDGKL